MCDFPIIQEVAELFGGPIQESLLFFRELWCGQFCEFLPIRHTGEQFTLPPYAAGFERIPLCFRKRGQHIAKDLKDTNGNVFTTQ